MVLSAFIDSPHRSTIPNRSLLDLGYLDEITLRFQGSLVEVKTNNPRVKMPDAVWENMSRRGQVTTFSRKSRTRLLKYTARFDWESHKAIFLTLTYHLSNPDAKTSELHRRAFLRRLERHTGTKHAVIWRREWQERGSIHFHFIIFDLPFVHWSEIQRMWREVTGDPTITNIKINLLDSPSKARRYVSKYTAKASGFSNLDTEPYLYAGRHWGIENRDLLPFAEEVLIVVNEAWNAFQQFKRFSRRYYPPLNRKYRAGWFLFVENSPRWLELWYFCLLEF